jgi:two-component system, response regulator PdtaR
MTILVLEDEAVIALDLADAFERSGHLVVCFAVAGDANAWLDDNRPSAAVLDFQLQDGDCRCLMRRIKHMGVPIVIHSGFALEELDIGKDELMGIPIALKPCDSFEIVELVEKLLAMPPIDLSA